MTQTLDNPVLPAPVLPIVRVAVLAERRIVEIALPTEVPLREVMPAVERLVHLDADDAAESAESAETAAPTARRRSLAPIGGAPYSLDASLDTVGVVDGDLLALVPVPAGPAAPGVVEDIADAAVIFSRSRLTGWGIDRIRTLARAAAVLLLLAVTGVGVAYRLSAGSVTGLYVVSAAAAIAVLTALTLHDRRDVPAVAALVPIAAAFTLAVPGEFGAAQLLLGAAGVTAWAAINVILSARRTALFTAVAVVGAALSVTAGIAVLWPGLPLATLGAGLILAALLVTVQAAGLSAVWARLPLPVIPAPGDPVPAAPSRSVLADLPRRVERADAHQSGLLAAAVALTVLGSLAVVVPVTGQAPAGVWAWYLVGGTSLASVLRARVWDSAVCKTWLLSQPFLLAVALLGLFVWQADYASALWTLVALAVLTGGWLIVAGNPRLADPDGYSLPIRRLVGFLSAGVDASLIPVIAYLVGIFALVLQR